MTKTIILIIILFTTSFNSYSQNIYKEKLKRCNTKQFALESKNKTAKIADKELIKFISQITTDNIRKKIRGTLKIQIIVYKNGTSCLLSYENETNIKSSELKINEFKTLVDSSLIWENGIENVATLIEIKYQKKKITFTRFGLNGITGWHKLKN